MTQAESESPSSLKGSALIAGAGVMALFLALLVIVGGRDVTARAVSSGGALLGLVVAVAALCQLARIHKRPERVGGLGWVGVGLACGLLAPAVWVLLAPTTRPREGSLAVCSANVNGIMKAMIVYSSDNEDHFPVVTPPAEPWTYRLNFGATAPSQPQANIDLFTQSGSPASIIWILINTGSVSPKSLLCSADPWTASTPAVMNVGDRWALAPQKDSQLSCSIAYPWQISKDGKMEPAAHWAWRVDSPLPMISDMAPKLTAPPPAGTTDWTAFNSPNHQGKGQNIAFSDAHAEWSRTPVVNGDNIWTAGASGLVTPGRVPVPLPTTHPDIIVVPTRDPKTGKVE